MSTMSSEEFWANTPSVPMTQSGIGSSCDEDSEAKQTFGRIIE